MNTLPLNPALHTDADAVLRIADQAGLSDHTIFQTSGSTGEPKFVCLSGEALEASARAVNCVMTATSWEIGRRIVELEQDAV